MRQKVVTSLVDRMLANPEINFRLIPDAIERRAYESILNEVLVLLTDIIERIRIEFFDHIITLKVEPKNVDLSL